MQLPPLQESEKYSLEKERNTVYNIMEIRGIPFATHSPPLSLPQQSNSIFPVEMLYYQKIYIRVGYQASVKIKRIKMYNICKHKITTNRAIS